tara:strand:- start:584 stop:1189 length:606 start_codon:yes stop_codon:yes gene_type:complete
MTNTNIVTPRGKLVYPHLNKADTKFDKDGVWRANLRIPKEEAKQLVDDIDNQIQSNATEETNKRNKKVKVANPPYTDDGEGNYVFNFKLKASGIRPNGERWSQKPILYDSKGNLFNNKDIIWGGTEAKVAFQPSSYYVPSIGAGVSLRLKAVQILNLVSSNQDASSYGFKQEEGFVAEADAEVEVSEDVAPKEATNNTADF